MQYLDELVLLTHRLFLRPYRMEDAGNFFSVICHREVSDMMAFVPHPFPRQKVEEWIAIMRNNIINGTGYEFGIFLRQKPSQYIGSCGLLSISMMHRNGELAYFIDPEQWNKGYATEACSRVIQFGFQDLGLERIAGRCMTKNIGSKKVMEKCGLQYEGFSRHEVLKEDKFEDVYRFGIIRSDWISAVGAMKPEAGMLQR